MDFSQLLTIEGVAWIILLLGWIAQMYLGYVKRSTRVSKRGIVLMLLGMVGILVASWMNGFRPVVIVQLIVVVVMWLVYIRRR